MIPAKNAGFRHATVTTILRTADGLRCGRIRLWQACFRRLCDRAADGATVRVPPHDRARAGHVDGSRRARTGGSSGRDPGGDDRGRTTARPRPDPRPEIPAGLVADCARRARRRARSAWGRARIPGCGSGVTAAKTLAYATGPPWSASTAWRPSAAMRPRTPAGSRSSPTPSAATSTWPNSADRSRGHRCLAAAETRVETLAAWLARRRARRHRARPGPGRAAAPRRHPAHFPDSVGRGELAPGREPHRAGPRGDGGRPPRESLVPRAALPPPERGRGPVGCPDGGLPGLNRAPSPLPIGTSCPPESIADQVGLRPPVEPVPDHPARGGPRDVPQPDRTLGRGSGGQDRARRRLRHGALPADRGRIAGPADRRPRPEPGGGRRARADGRPAARRDRPGRPAPPPVRRGHAST